MTDTSVKQLGKRPLVRVFQAEIGGLPIAVCDGRELHAFLQVGKRFASWMTERISEYGFIKNQDFLIISPNREKSGKGRPAKNYQINLDMAKELSMVEKNDKGREARRYFIAMERRALAQAQTQSNDQARNLYLPQQPLGEAGQAVLKRFSTSRFLCSFDFDGNMGLHEIPHNAVVIPQDRLADFIGDPAGAPRATLGDILEAIARRVNTLN